MEELREIYMRRAEDEEEQEKQEKQDEREAGRSNICTTNRPPLKKREQVDACWQETLQRFLEVQELGNDYIHTVSTVTMIRG